MKKFALAALMVAALMGSTKAHANYVIDDFDAPGFPNQQFIQATTTGTRHNGVSGVPTLGGTRDLSVTRSSTVGTVSLNVDRIVSDFLSYSQSVTTPGASVDGALSVTYDGTSDGGGAPNTNGNPAGIAGASPSPTLTNFAEDLTQGGVNNKLQLRFLSNSNVLLNITVELYDGSGLSSTYTLSNYAASNATSLFIKFSDFSDPSAFSNVHAFKLIIDPASSVGGATLQLDAIQTLATPEPTSIALLGMGVLGLAARGLRRRKVAA